MGGHQHLEHYCYTHGFGKLEKPRLPKKYLGKSENDKVCTVVEARTWNETCFTYPYRIIIAM